ncbi:pseudouridylate synthase RPUSD4, mitochondrial-like [Zophobas morio]|uniref:pseudouridylate synthase RPUSD4, mitochondrial-like n=1 Tax=Zophobas morio TaxID=2755281 RepID=UPI003083525D
MKLISKKLLRVESEGKLSRIKRRSTRVTIGDTLHLPSNLEPKITKLSHLDCFSQNAPPSPRLLQQCILYSDKNIIVINKPYGLSIKDSGKHSLRLEDYLEILKISETDDLRIINHIDQFSTGIVILARTPDIANRLKYYVRSSLETLEYWGIGIGVPAKSSAKLSTPVTVSLDSSGRQFVRCRPELKKISPKMYTNCYRYTYNTCSEYQVMDSFMNKLSLLRMRIILPAKKDTLPAHIAQLAKTPLVGCTNYMDHCAVELRRDAEKLLGKVGRVCLHAKSILLSLGYASVPIEAPLPEHFLSACKKVSFDRLTKEVIFNPPPKKRKTII